MKPSVIDIASNVVVRDYIQHFWQVATDIVNLNSDGKNKYELRREAEELILTAIDKTIESRNEYYQANRDYIPIEVLLYDLWWMIYNISAAYDSNKLTETWCGFYVDLNKIAKHLEDEYTHRLNQLIDKSNAS
jgi:hypothetical protein